MTHLHMNILRQYKSKTTSTIVVASVQMSNLIEGDKCGVIAKLIVASENSIVLSKIYDSFVVVLGAKV